MSEEIPEQEPTPAFPFEWMPLQVGQVNIVGWDGFSYIDENGLTYWSGLEPSAEDCASSVNTPRVIPQVRVKKARTIMDRLTPTEYAALHTARMANPEVDAFVLKAVSEGIIRDDDPDFAAAVTALDAAGIISSNRWGTLLA